jgi:hypothetical protein
VASYSEDNKPDSQAIKKYYLTLPTIPTLVGVVFLILEQEGFVSRKQATETPLLLSCNKVVVLQIVV